MSISFISEYNNQHFKLLANFVTFKNSTTFTYTKFTADSTKNLEYNSNLNCTNLNPTFNFSSWPILFLSVFAIVGFVGNLLVCIAIKIDPKLQNATNYYLFSLATTDLLVSIIVIPLNILKNFYSHWILGKIACTLFVFLDVFFCTTSILLLCIISCERYFGIKNPLKNRDKSKSKTKLIILVAWIVSFLLSSPILILGYLDSRNVIQNGNCSLYNKHFIIYGSIISFIIPLFIMIIMYCLTVHRLQRVLKKFKTKEFDESSRSSDSPKMKKIKCSIKTKNDDQIYIQNDRMFFKTQLKNKNFQLNSLQPHSCYNISINNKNQSSFKTILNSSDPSLFCHYSNNNHKSHPDNSNEALRFKSLVSRQNLINRTVYALQSNKASTVVMNEEKAVKVLGIVFIVFVIAWAPFAIFNILSAICETCSFHSFLNILTWLGYISSNINPIIYNAFNEKFRYTFKKIITCQLNSLRKPSYKKQNKILTKLAAENSRLASTYNYMSMRRSRLEPNS